MNVPAQTKAAIDYQICRYGGSRLAFRGPERALTGAYVAVLGGSETFGKFVPSPFPDLLEAEIGLPVVNLGIMQAGPPAFLADRHVLEIAAGAQLCVLQLPGAQNISNRFYSVHPRRNDRFLTGSGSLQAIFPKVDLTEFNFTGHFLTALGQREPEAFEHVVDELKIAWVRRMKELLTAIGGRAILLWMSERRPEDGGRNLFEPDPLFVDRAMLNDLSPHAGALIEVTASQRARREGLKTRAYLPGEEAAALALPGPRFHREVADALIETLGPRLHGPEFRRRSRSRRPRT